MIKSWRVSIFLAALSFALTACVPSSIMQIDIDEFRTGEEARQAFNSVVSAVLELNLVARKSSNESKEKLIEIRGNVLSEFLDPKSPVQKPPQTWFVLVQLSKANHRVSLVLAQPGANEPSDAMVKRRDELLLDLKKMLPQFVNIKVAEV